MWKVNLFHFDQTVTFLQTFLKVLLKSSFTSVKNFYQIFFFFRWWLKLKVSKRWQIKSNDILWIILNWNETSYYVLWTKQKEDSSSIEVFSCEKYASSHQNRYAAVIYYVHIESRILSEFERLLIRTKSNFLRCWKKCKKSAFNWRNFVRCISYQFFHSSLAKSWCLKWQIVSELIWSF